MGSAAANPAQLAQRMRADFDFYGWLIREPGIRGDGS